MGRTRGCFHRRYDTGLEELTDGITENTPMHTCIHRESRCIFTNMLSKVVGAFLFSFLLNYFSNLSSINLCLLT